MSYIFDDIFMINALNYGDFIVFYILSFVKILKYLHSIKIVQFISTFVNFCRFTKPTGLYCSQRVHNIFGFHFFRRNSVFNFYRGLLIWNFIFWLSWQIWRSSTIGKKTRVWYCWIRHILVILLRIFFYHRIRDFEFFKKV